MEKSYFKNSTDSKLEVGEVSDASDVITILRENLNATLHHVYLTEEISNQRYYTELFHSLRTARKDKDKFVFYINNFGGMLHTTIELINAMRNCEAMIIVQVSGPIYSAAPLIALQGDKIVMEDHSLMMFHDYSGGSYGKGNEQEKSIKHHQQLFRGCFHDYCKGFLSTGEVNKILSGEDLYLHKKECERRLKKLKKFVVS